LLHLDGYDLAGVPLEQRKEALRALLDAGGAGTTLRYSDHVAGNGEAFLRHACRMALEGVVSKRRDAPYESGRGRRWLKAKCIQEQEFVVGGFTDPEGRRSGIGALLLGVNDDGNLVYVGKVGTGFPSRMAVELRRRLEALGSPTCPFVKQPAGTTHAHWVRPELVGEVEFTEWTPDGRLRHPSWKGLREDKPAREIVRERPAGTAGAGPARRESARGGGARGAAGPGPRPPARRPGDGGRGGGGGRADPPPRSRALPAAGDHEGRASAVLRVDRGLDPAPSPRAADLAGPLSRGLGEGVFLPEARRSVGARGAAPRPHPGEKEGRRVPRRRRSARADRPRADRHSRD